MDKSTIMTLIAFSLFFICGFGWGQWFAERTIRKDRATSEHERMVVSIPMSREDASAILELLSAIVKKVKSERGND